MPCWAGLRQAFCGCRRKGKALCRRLGRVVLLENSEELPARAGWGCVWTSAPVHAPSSKPPAELQGAALLHQMKAVGELLSGAVCAGSVCCAVCLQQLTSALEELHSVGSAAVEAGWSWVIPSVQTQLTLSSYPAEALESALPPAAVTAMRGTAPICAFPVYHSFVLQSLLMAPNEIKAALAGGFARTVRHSCIQEHLI